MGFGTHPWGLAPFGFDPQVFSSARDATPPAALAFDGTTRNYKLDSRGRFQEAHPVDAKVFLILRTLAGSIRSAPTTGQTVNAIAYIDQLRVRAQVEDRVRSALAPVINAGEIRLDNIEIDTSVRGRIMFEVTYFNRVSGKPETARP